jgi:glucose-1-phosphate thymidylyltransferase
MREPQPGVVLEPAQAVMATLGLKTMIPFAGRPFLDYVLTALADADYRDVCIVVGHAQQLIETYYTITAPPTRIAVTFVAQEAPRGTAGAVLACETFAGQDDFLMINSDNYYPVAALTALRSLGEPGLAAFRPRGLLEGSNITPDRLQSYAAVFVGPDGYLDRIIEKPGADLLASPGRNTFISMNCWRFSPVIFPACRAISPSARGELELADAVQYSISARHERFRAVPLDLPVLDLSNQSDVARVAALLAGVPVRT